MSLKLIALALAMAIAPLAQDNRPAQIPPAFVAGEDPGVWLAEHVEYGPQWRGLTFNFGGQEFINRAPFEAQDGPAFAARIERANPQTQGDFTWRSALGVFRQNCGGFTELLRLTLYEGQNLTGEFRAAESNEGVYLRRYSDLHGEACGATEALRREPRGSRNEPSGPTPGEAQTWVAQNLDFGAEWAPPAINANTVTAVSRERGTDNQGRITLSLRTEYFEPEIMSGRIARSMREEVTFDCAARRARSTEINRYARRNLQGAEEEVYPVGVLAFNTEPGLSARLITEICGEAAPVETAQAEPATPALKPAPPEGIGREAARAWIHDNIPYGREWDLVVDTPVGLLVRRDITPTDDGLRFTLRQEYASPLRGVTSSGLPLEIRSQVETFDATCRRARAETSNGQSYEGQQLTGTQVGAGIGISGRVRQQLINALCDDQSIAAGEVAGPANDNDEALQAWIGDNIDLEGWTAPINGYGAVWMLSPAGADGPPTIRAEFFSPLLIGLQDDNGMLVRSYTTSYFVTCADEADEPHQAFPAGTALYGRRNLQGRAERVNLRGADPLPEMIQDYYLSLICS